MTYREILIRSCSLCMSFVVYIQMKLERGAEGYVGRMVILSSKTPMNSAISFEESSFRVQLIWHQFFQVCEDVIDIF